MFTNELYSNRSGRESIRMASVWYRESTLGQGICQIGGGLGGGLGGGFGLGGGRNNGMNRGSNGGGPNGGRPVKLPGPLGDQNDGGDDSGDQPGGGLLDILGSILAPNDDDSGILQKLLSEVSNELDGILKQLGGDVAQLISNACKRPDDSK
ncbi:hypothetical protein CEXT_304721 [Caerostris extrusa]|uniref:Uncharacterized protein n=1 Tax=Caerostris extrusa TaxID=172846 RepID=A0AAV4S027_CAEEX|nr:hypothetical protein CEXT_304721 [Caerostris extrusa]